MNVAAMTIFAIALVVLAVADWYVWETKSDTRMRRFLKLLRS